MGGRVLVALVLDAEVRARVGGVEVVVLVVHVVVLLRPLLAGLIVVIPAVPAPRGVYRGFLVLATSSDVVCGYREQHATYNHKGVSTRRDHCNFRLLYETHMDLVSRSII